VGMDSAILERILERRVRKEREWLRQRGLHTHIKPDEIRVKGLFGGDTYENGGIRIGALALLGKTLRHELAHRAHLERSFAPTKELRKQKNYPDAFSAEYGAISEMLAALAEHETMNIVKLERTTKKAYDNYGDSLGRAAMLLAVRDALLQMWKTLRRAGLGRKEAHDAILHALYNSKTLADIGIYREVMPKFAALRKTGVNTNPSEVLAMRWLKRLRT